MTKTQMPFRIFVGYDRSEIVAYHTFCQSIIAISTVPISFTPLALNHLSSSFERPRDPLQSTDFSFSRFLVPYLSGYEGWSLFADGDMLLRFDIAELIKLVDENHSVMVCQHDYTPRSEFKFLDHKQTKYVKKNWSSLMLFNNSKCKALTPAYVNSASGLELHQFKWLASEDEIGALPLEWNWLVGEYEKTSSAKLVHFTLGGPYFRDFAESDYAEEWLCVKDEMTSSKQK